MGDKLLRNVYKMVCESRMMYGVEIWGVEERWKEIGKAHGRMCKKFLGILRFAANGVAELESGRDYRRGKYMYIGEILVKDFADGQGWFSKSVLRLANK
jgi:hypothetical protein